MFSIEPLESGTVIPTELAIKNVKVLLPHYIIDIIEGEKKSQKCKSKSSFNKIKI